MKHALRTWLAALAACGALWGAGPAKAQFQGRSIDEVVQVSFLPGWRMADGNHMAALRIVLAPGWKTYWRAPGEGGVPTVVTLGQGQGVSGPTIHWPRPEVFFINGMRSIGYRGDVILPMEFGLTHSGQAAITGRIEMGVCQDVCLPITLDLTGVLPQSGAPMPEITRALSDRPMTAREAGAGPARCAVEPISDGLRVTVTVPSPVTGADETIVVEHADPRIWVSETATRREGGLIHAIADVVPPLPGPFALNRSDLHITVIGSRMAIALDGCTG